MGTYTRGTWALGRGGGRGSPPTCSGELLGRPSSLRSRETERAKASFSPYSCSVRVLRGYVAPIRFKSTVPDHAICQGRTLSQC